jgi:SAM-dependent methyltransferase
MLAWRNQVNQAGPHSRPPERDGSAPPEDRSTTEYFDSHAPEYSVGRLQFAADFIKAQAGPGNSLIDIGCGVGNTLEHLVNVAGISRAAGMDVSAKCLEETQERLPCTTYQGSILDHELVRSIDERFDFAVLAAILHHLIGKNRRDSKEYARMAISHSLELVRPGGYVVIHEPIYAPRAATMALFWVKKALTAITSQRVQVAGPWANIGPPVVSYLTNEELLGMAGADPRGSVVETDLKSAQPPPLARPVLRGWNTTVIIGANATG